jgi:hypothetical protein
LVRVLATSSSVADSSERTETGLAIPLFKDVLDYKGRHREVMGGRGWTELFFLDEAVALAAGHHHARQGFLDSFGVWTVPVCLLRIRGDPRDRGFADSPLEESGFEPLVPLTLNPTNAGERDEKKRSSSW